MKKTITQSEYAAALADLMGECPAIAKAPPGHKPLAEWKKIMGIGKDAARDALNRLVKSGKWSVAKAGWADSTGRVISINHYGPKRGRK